MRSTTTTARTDLVQRREADHLDAHLVGPQDGRLDLLVDAIFRERQEVLQGASEEIKKKLLRGCMLQQGNKKVRVRGNTWKPYLGTTQVWNSRPRSL